MEIPDENKYTLLERIKRVEKAYEKIEKCSYELDRELDILNCSPNYDCGYSYGEVGYYFLNMLDFIETRWLRDLKAQLESQEEEEEKK